MPKLQLTNAGAAPIVLKDPEGYTTFAAEIAPSTTVERAVTQDLLQRLAPLLKALEVPSLAADGSVLVALRWAVVKDASDDARVVGGSLAGLPSLNELQAASYSTGSGATAAVATGTAMLGGQVKSSLQTFEGSARLDLEAVTPGAPGNDISLEIITPSSTLLVTVAASKITVRPAAGGSTVLAIANAINAEASALLLVQAAEGVAGNITVAVPEAFLSGGEGPGVSLALDGTACVVTAMSDTSITFNAPTGISAASRVIPLELRNGPNASRVSVPVVA